MPAATRRLIEEFAAWPEGGSAPDQLDELTDREREVMALAAYGLTNREIAVRLCITHATAKTHVGQPTAPRGPRARRARLKAAGPVSDLVADQRR